MLFKEPNYYKNKFTGLALEKEDTESIRFEECTFSDCRLIECKFDKCVFIDCRFEGSILSTINPNRSRFLHPSFMRCKVMSFDWAKAAKLQDLSFDECQLDYSNFSLLKLPKIKMIKCSVKEARFVETEMKDGVFTETDFQGSTFFKSDFSGADFRRARNYEIDINNNVVKKAKFAMPEVLALLNGLEIEIE